MGKGEKKERHTYILRLFKAWFLTRSKKGLGIETKICTWNGKEIPGGANILCRQIKSLNIVGVAVT